MSEEDQNENDLPQSDQIDTTSGLDQADTTDVSGELDINSPAGESNTQDDQASATVDPDLLSTEGPETKDRERAEHTPETTSNQGQLGSDNNLTPWVDYIPKPAVKKPDSREEALQLRYEMINQTLIENEYSLLEYIQKFNVLKSPRYYLDYQHQANVNFRAVAALKRRKIGGKPVDLPLRNIEDRQLPLKPRKKAS